MKRGGKRTGRLERGEPCRQQSPRSIVRSPDEERSGRHADRPAVDRRGDRAPPACRSRLVARCERLRRVVRGVRSLTGVVQIGRDRASPVGFGVYAIEKDRHLRRLALLRGDSMRITLVVADELMFSGALAERPELLDLRDGIGHAARDGSRQVLPTSCRPSARGVRLVGPSGEVPIAAERELIARTCRVTDDRDRRRTRRCARGTAGAQGDGRRSHGARRADAARRRRLALLEAVSPPGDRYRAGRRRAGRRLRPRRGRGTRCTDAERLASPPVGELDGQVAIITGGASGIGARDGAAVRGRGCDRRRARS